MKYLFLILSPFSLFSDELEYFFQGLANQPLELLSFFIPPRPNIETIHPYLSEEFEWIQRWPGATFSQNQIDFLRLRLDESTPFEGISSKKLSSCRAIYLDAFVFGSSPFLKVKEFLTQEGFIPFSSWIREGVQAGILFVKTECFYNQRTASYLQTHTIDETYHYYPQRYFPICYCLDGDEGDSVKQVLKTGHPYEGNISLMLQAIAKPKSIAIDIGAHVGVHTIFMSRKVGNEGAVLSFEPNPKLYMEHLHTLKINQCRNVIPICKGLGEEEKKEILHRITIEQEDDLEEEGEEIEIVPLDSFSLNHISLIKMDVENYEYFVLKGAKNTLLKNKPPILFECWIGYEYGKKDPVHQRENFDRVMALLDSYGYDIYIIYNCDFLAIPRGTQDETLLSYKQKLKKLDPATYQGEPLIEE